MTGLLVLLVVACLSASSASAADCHMCSKKGRAEATAAYIAQKKKNEQNQADFLEQFVEATNVRKMWAKVKETYEMVSNLMMDNKAAMTAIEVAQEKIQQEAKLRIEEAKLQHDYALPVIKASADQAREAAQPPAEQSGLCYMITARQVIPVMDQFADILARSALEGLENEHLGDGPFYASRMRRLRCGQINKNDPVTGSSADGAGCKGSQNVQIANGLYLSFEGLGVSAMTMSPDSVVMMAPQLTETTETMPNGQTRKVLLAVAKDGNVQQQVWLAAYDYCASIANPRPLPAAAAEIKTPDGLARAANQSTCMTRESSYLHVCAQRLGRLSRPDCSVEQMKPFCEAARNLCIAAKAYGLPLEDRFEDCKNGLSYYESETIAVRLCEAVGRVHDKVAGGAKKSELAALASMCNGLGGSLKERKSEDWTAFTQMTKDIQKLKSCWAEAK